MARNFSLLGELRRVLSKTSLGTLSESQPLDDLHQVDKGAIALIVDYDPKHHWPIVLVDGHVGWLYEHEIGPIEDQQRIPECLHPENSSLVRSQHLVTCIESTGLHISEANPLERPTSRTSGGATW